MSSALQPALPGIASGTANPARSGSVKSDGGTDVVQQFDTALNAAKDEAEGEKKRAREPIQDAGLTVSSRFRELVSTPQQKERGGAVSAPEDVDGLLHPSDRPEREKARAADTAANGVQAAPPIEIAFPVARGVPLTATVATVAPPPSTGVNTPPEPGVAPRAPDRDPVSRAGSKEVPASVIAGSANQEHLPGDITPLQVRAVSQATHFAPRQPKQAPFNRAPPAPQVDIFGTGTALQESPGQGATTEASTPPDIEKRTQTGIAPIERQDRQSRESPEAERSGAVGTGIQTAVQAPANGTSPVSGPTPFHDSVTRTVASALIKTVAPSSGLVSASVELARGAGGPVRTVTIELNPASLGIVVAELRFRDGTLDVKLMPERGDVADMLQRNGDRLRLFLEKAGYALDTVSVTLQPPPIPSSLPPSPTAESFSANAQSGGSLSGQGHRDQPHARQPSEQGATTSRQNETRSDEALYPSRFTDTLYL